MNYLYDQYFGPMLADKTGANANKYRSYIKTTNVPNDFWQGAAENRLRHDTGLAKEVFIGNQTIAALSKPEIYLSDRTKAIQNVGRKLKDLFHMEYNAHLQAGDNQEIARKKAMNEVKSQKDKYMRMVEYQYPKHLTERAYESFEQKKKAERRLAASGKLAKTPTPKTSPKIPRKPLPRSSIPPPPPKFTKEEIENILKTSGLTAEDPLSIKLDELNKKQTMIESTLLSKQKELALKIDEKASAEKAGKDVSAIETELNNLNRAVSTALERVANAESEQFSIVQQIKDNLKSKESVDSIN